MDLFLRLWVYSLCTIDSKTSSGEVGIDKRKAEVDAGAGKSRSANLSAHALLSTRHKASLPPTFWRARRDTYRHGSVYGD